MADVPPFLFRTFAKTVTVGEEHGLRPGTEIKTMPVTYVLNGAGLGDFICYSVALRWISDHLPWVYGRIVCPDFFVPFLRRILWDHPTWAIIPGDKGATLREGELTIAPNTDVKGVQTQVQLLNATGGHLITLGFAYFANMTPPPEDATYPLITQPKERLHRKLRGKEGKYVVFTPGGVTTSRTVRGEYLNPVIEYVVSKGLIPVFLGKASKQKSVDPKFPDDIRYDLGIDLRNETTILDAACVMEHSLCTLGLDNGLLHLACCTPGNVIFAYNIAGPAQRLPWRKAGHTENIFLTKKELACANCQETKGLFNHSYHYCYYNDLKCIDLLFANGGERFRCAIDKILKLNSAG